MIHETSNGWYGARSGQPATPAARLAEPEAGGIPRADPGSERPLAQTLSLPHPAFTQLDVADS